MKAWICILITVYVSATFLPGCGGSKESRSDEKHAEHSRVVKLSAESIQQINLEIDTARLQPLGDYLTLPARVVTNQDKEAQIGSLVRGRVHQVYVNVGDVVRAGQVLMTVEGLEIGEIKADFMIAKAMLEYTRTNYERQRKLFDEKIGSQKALAESQAEYEKAMAEYKAEDKKIHSVGLSDQDVSDGHSGAEHTSGTLPIKTAIDGVVVERNVVIGQLVDATTNAFKVININSVWVDGQIYEKDLSLLNHKTNALFITPAYRQENFSGRIIYIGQTVDELSRTITVRGEFSNSDRKLKPQMFGELKIPIGADTMALLLAEESVVKDAGEEYVFVQTSDTTFEKRNVISGTSVDKRIELKSGLQEGEKVVCRGVFYLKSELKKDELAGDEH
jgi:membrane fusion protein, heavy metal efflux system